MREYIDKQKLLMALNDKCHDMAYMPASYYAGFQYAVKLIEKIHVNEEVAPVRHGRWIEVNPAYGIYECSVCRTADEDCSDYYGTHNVKGQDYCPACGAKMDLGDESDDQ